MMSAGGDVFSRISVLAEGLGEAVLTSHTLLGIGVILVILLQVVIVLCGLYLRPRITGRQVLKFLLICFSAMLFCCMTIWLLWKLAFA